MPSTSRLPPGWTPLGAKLFGAFMSLVLTGMGASGLAIIRADWLSGSTAAHHGAILQAKEPIAFAVRLAIVGAASVVLLATGLYMGWFTAFSPAEMRARRLRARRRARR